MHYTYIIRSTTNPSKIYVGYTSDLKQRIKTHNLGKAIYTAQYTPWELEFYSAFRSKKKALDFERYLKSGSGKVFSEKRLLR